MDLYLKIATQIQSFFKEESRDLPPAMAGKVLRVDVAIPTIAPLTWLARQTAPVKTYWCDRQGRFTMAGIGSIDTISGDVPIDYPVVFGQLRAKLSSLFPNVRYYGGIGFDRQLWLDSSWQLFGNYRFVMPRFEIWSDGEETFFSCNFLGDIHSPQWLQELDTILVELQQLDFTQLAIATAPPTQIGRTDKPNYSQWQHNVNLALAKFPTLQLEKIVLARQSTLTFSTDLQPQLLLLLLQPHNPSSYHFCFQIDPQTAFIGTSPERLYHRQDRLLKTEAIAGTRPRGTTPEPDRLLGAELHDSPKDVREHQLVVNNLRTILAELCHTVEIDRAATILKLNKVQHLYTQCRGLLAADLTDAEILPQLHPTPAVGGFPRPQALALIRELEPFERGWYAAPVGWVGYDDVEFAVAIRSGLVDRDRLLLFAGAGIVEGSQAAAEWTEIENKIRHFTDLFTEPTNLAVIKEHRAQIEQSGSST
ncbi:isochorismate synthase [Chamaesiphon sp. VAR_69_metabat_338]|uniref:isochorismate synthase n=1 Tax=Chamaesiphon sp. VAR_69_metabat_338 TaxID=2964704 RepID=UPI00286D7331|nr:isochorismate synthase [Chamaesiphon sp. VAR_69_metabat_338]